MSSSTCVASSGSPPAAAPIPAHRRARSIMLRVREARRSDAAVIHQLIGELADFEKLRQEFNGSVSDLELHLCDGEPYARVLLAEVDAQVAGFALYFFNYSTFLCKPGI